MFQIYFASILIAILACILFIWILNLSFSKIKFTEINGPIQLLENERRAEHNGSDSILATVRINQIYSKGIYSIQLSFEKSSSSSTFIGIIESNNKQSISSSHGWFISDEQVICHKPEEYQIFQVLKNIWSFFDTN